MSRKKECLTRRVEKNPLPIEESSPARLTVSQVPGVYSRLSPLYGFWEQFAEGRARRFALHLAGVRPGERILEVGIGPGTALEQLARRNSTGLTVGLDLTPDMLQKTRGRFLRNSLASPRLCQSDARFLPFADSSFDLVFSAYLLDLLSLADIETTLREMRRVLRPSGRLVLLHLTLGNRWFNRLWGLLYGLVPMLLGGCRPIRLAAQSGESGLLVLQNQRVVQCGIPSEVILARRQD